MFRPIAPHDPSLGFGNNRNTFMNARPAYRTQFNGGSRIWNYNGNRDWDHDGDRGRRHDRDHDGDRDRFRGRERGFHNRYLYSYPATFGYIYPYYIGPGFYDGSEYDNSGYDQNNAASGSYDQGAGYQAENPNGDYGEPGGGSYGEPVEQPQPYPEPQAVEPAPNGHFTVSGMDAASEYTIEGPITVIFKGGRAPAKMQNYMLTAKTLTDLDADHYEKIPLDQVDLAATAETNRANGVDFQVPGPAQY